jgi:hypothetical protein
MGNMNEYTCKVDVTFHWLLLSVCASSPSMLIAWNRFESRSDSSISYIWPSLGYLPNPSKGLVLQTASLFVLDGMWNWYPSCHNCLRMHGSISLIDFDLENERRIPCAKFAERDSRRKNDGAESAAQNLRFGIHRKVCCVKFAKQSLPGTVQSKEHVGLACRLPGIWCFELDRTACAMYRNNESHFDISCVGAIL